MIQFTVLFLSTFLLNEDMCKVGSFQMIFILKLITLISCVSLVRLSAKNWVDTAVVSSKDTKRQTIIGWPQSYQKYYQAVNEDIQKSRRLSPKDKQQWSK